MSPDRTPKHVRQRRELRYVRLVSLGYGSYADYLRSPHWASIKAQYRAAEDLPQACMCGAEEGLQLHHKTYERVGVEELSDLAPLCENCHAMIHALERRGEIKLDFEGFESTARAQAYAATRLHHAPIPSHTERLDAMPLWYRVHLLEQDPHTGPHQLASLEQRIARAERRAA